MSSIDDFVIQSSVTEPVSAAEIMANMTRLCADITAAEERRERDIKALADSGASDTVIIAFAIALEIRKYPAPAVRPFGLSWLGATEYDLARAAVDALRIAGRLQERAA